MDILSNSENACLFLKMKAIQNLPWIQASRFFHKQSILCINICFRKDMKKNLFNLVHTK